MRKFAAMVEKGEMSQETFDKWASMTDTKDLPEKAPRKAGSVIRRPKGARGVRGTK